MSRIAIADLNFLEAALPNERDLKGGSITPNIATSLTTATATRLGTNSSIAGTLLDGFQLNINALGQAAAAGAAAGSIGGGAYTFALAINK